MQSYREFVHNLNFSKTFLLAGLKHTAFSSNMKFFNARELTIYRCDKFSAYYCANKSIFPNIKTINYLLPDCVDIHMYDQFDSDVLWLSKHESPIDKDHKHIRISNGQYFKAIHEYSNQYENYLRNYIAEMQFRNGLNK